MGLSLKSRQPSYYVDAASGWIKASKCGDPATEKVIPCLSAEFGRIEVSHALISDNAKEFVNDDVVT